jgi:branched-chain amino acid transport system substrate-binding protein
MKFRGFETEMKERTEHEIAILLLAILAISAVLTLLPMGPVNAASSNKVIKIGVVTDLSTAYSYYGDMEVNGLALGLAYGAGATNVATAISSTPTMVNVTAGGYTFELYIADGASDPTTTTEKAVQLITQDGVQILQGAPDSTATTALEGVAAQYHIIFFAGPGADYSITANTFNVYTFRMASNTYQDALTGGAYAVQHMGKSVAFIAPDYSWGYGEVAAWTDVISSNGGRVLTTQYAPVGTTDFTPYINNILATNATVLIPAWAGAGAIQLYQQLYSLGVYNKMNVTSGVPDLATFDAYLAQYMPNYVGMMKYAFNLPNNAVNTWMIQNYITLFKAGKLPEQNAYTFPLPDLFVPDSFAVGQAIVNALNATGGSTTPANMIAALEGMSVSSPKGSMYIRPQDHQAMQDMYIVKTVYDNSSMHAYYSSASQFPAGNAWAGILKTGYIGVQLIATLNGTQTAPPIYPGTAGQPRPAVQTTTTSTTTPVSTTTVVSSATQTSTLTQTSVLIQTATVVQASGVPDYVYLLVAVVIVAVVAALFVASRRKST